VSLDRWQQILREVTGIAGVRGALIVSAEDGLVVAESAMENVATGDVAALAAALVVRAQHAAQAAQGELPRSVHLSATGGVLLAMAGPDPLWLVALADSRAELGRLRVLLGDFAVALG
jgi:predicted regulator of Ras-like GTPase activity (Roadblock/LC7/MglB family)